MTIELQGIELHGFHGVLDDERRDGQRFLVDLELDLADETAAASDDIEDAVDYRDVVETILAVSNGRAYHLLEAFAAAIADALVARFPLTRARVRVRKPDVELARPVDHAAVIVERRPV
jgi:7,8-dihydroneopterin aldolase/epimerase/oxygenase